MNRRTDQQGDHQRQENEDDKMRIDFYYQQTTGRLGFLRGISKIYCLHIPGFTNCSLSKLIQLSLNMQTLINIWVFSSSN